MIDENLMKEAVEGHQMFRHAVENNLPERIELGKRLEKTLNTIGAWSSLASTVFVPHTEEEYQRLAALLDGLIDEVGENESHPLASLMEVISIILEKYEDEHIPELAVE